MNNLKTNVEAKKNKNVDIFLISEEVGFSYYCAFVVDRVVLLLWALVTAIICNCDGDDGNEEDDI